MPPWHHVTFTVSISKTYKAIELAEPDQNIHRFVWRSNQKILWMTRVHLESPHFASQPTCQPSRNANDFVHEYPMAANVVEKVILHWWLPDQCRWCQDCNCNSMKVAGSLLSWRISTQKVEFKWTVCGWSHPARLAGVQWSPPNLWHWRLYHNLG